MVQRRAASGDVALVSHKGRWEREAEKGEYSLATYGEVGWGARWSGLVAVELAGSLSRDQLSLLDWRRRRTKAQAG